jgi:hypothetical protein
MAQPWPPPPDIASIRELVATADPEGYIADGAPTDEYDHEADQLQGNIVDVVTAELTVANLLPIIEPIWSESFNLDAPGLALRRPALTALAQQIERFFGPAATPQVRSK